jgi:hypothetical protein
MVLHLEGAALPCKQHLRLRGQGRQQRMLQQLCNAGHCRLLQEAE